ncbi:MAG: hypothetical protein AVDCRST_MAG60-675 [uncultured Nocardioides sp.]|uniref:Uncharacterized protein n=1 Tax=uncultured Nocardioides sp. TaxID=198441 RepID=A0A6J4NA03_9ACTN|nr:MAG: hypothetical protein AVDCRST_MAG60-675 [uncultured Nocardioides sp.]
MIGTRVSRASAAVPRINARTVKECEMPASGKPATASPAVSRRRAARYAAAGASRSTGMCCIRSIAPATGRLRQMSWRHMNRR